MLFCIVVHLCLRGRLLVTVIDSYNLGFTGVDKTCQCARIKEIQNQTQITDNDRPLTI